MLIEQCYSPKNKQKTANNKCKLPETKSMIDRYTIQKIFESARIEEVVGEFVSLRKRGVNMLGLCPFHDEKTPSFTVSPAKGIYKCFGCGKGGNSVNFIMEHESLSYPEALRYLANKYNIKIEEKELTEEERKNKTKRESLLIVNEYALKYFKEILTKDPNGKAIGKSYFKERGFTDKIIDKFDLGYCLNKRNEFTNDAIKKGYKAEFLIETGLTIERNGNYYDRFFGRAIFPIHGISGKVIAFGGRTLRSDKKTAKYINSPESEVYNKSKVLYGIYFAKNAIVKQNKCYMVEGYTDVLSMQQAGIENVVASSGTSLTEGQIRLVKRFTKNITIIYDGDNAGIKASIRGIDLVLKEGMNVKVLPLPEGEDPDSFSKNMPPDALIDFINKYETDFIAFKCKLLLTEAADDPIKKAELINDVLNSISLVPNEVMRDLYIKETARLFDIKEETLFSEINKLLHKEAEKQFNKAQRQEYKETKETSRENENKLQPTTISTFTEMQHIEREVIKILLNYGTQLLEHEDGKEYVAHFIVREIANDGFEFENDLFRKIFMDYELHYKNDGTLIDDTYFIQHNDENICSVTADLLLKRYELSKLWQRDENFIKIDEFTIELAVPKLIKAFKEIKLRKLIPILLEELKNPEIAQNVKLWHEKMQKYLEFKKIYDELIKVYDQRVVQRKEI